ncbi:MAG: Na(+)-translocating NADH-quinone reductase subunit A [Rhodothermales bacterium]|nr:Na(+)-translocating NADH-quinone reductase subunit A [Rhodothermales bacterium]
MNNSVIKLKRGYDINLRGKAEKTFLDIAQPKLFALQPRDILGISPMPKLHVKEGDEVKAGQPIYFDKPSPTVQYCAPMSGEIVEVRRGQKRAIEAVVILADSKVEFYDHGRLSDRATREEIVQYLVKSGAWVLMRQRPFNVVPEPDVVPRDIFISCFDTSPLAPDYGMLMQGKESAFQQGLRVLGKLTSGRVHLGLPPTGPEVFTRAEGVVKHTFSGPHPAGNVGVHIHHVAPIRKGDVVWVVKPQDVAIIGRLATDGIFDAQRTVAVVGDELTKTGYFKTRIGAALKPMLEGRLKNDHVRVISGNPLTGTRTAKDGFLGLFDDQLTIIEEGDRPEFLGWLFPSYPRPSLSRTFLSYLTPNKEFHVNTNNHGELRAYVMTGEYEAVVPMDIYPQHLIKSILYRDFDQMEGLGIYEVVEEDLALCEFVCTSKQPVQNILREGLDAMRVEG